jgi:hypothetical protein
MAPDCEENLLRYILGIGAHDTQREGKNAIRVALHKLRKSFLIALACLFE